MSVGTLLIVAGVLIFVVGIAKMGSHQSGGFSLKNFGINFGGRVSQTNKMRDVAPTAGRAAKTDWGGVTIAVVGFLTALVGLLK